MKYLLIDIAMVLAPIGGVFVLVALINSTLELIFKGEWVAPIVAGVTQSIKAILDGHPRWHTLTACQREALHHIASKIARIMNGDSNYLDNWHDIACYATLVENDISEGGEK